MKRFLLSLAVCLALQAGGCTSMHDLTPAGDAVQLTHRGRTFTCELLAVDDSLVYFIPLETGSAPLDLLPGKIYASPPALFSGLSIGGYANRNWIAPVLLLEVAPAFIVGGVYGVYNNNVANGLVLTAGLLVIPAVNVLLFELGTTETPRLPDPCTTGSMHELRKYARYPQRLSAEQMQLLLALREQEAPLRLESAAGGWHAGSVPR